MRRQFASLVTRKTTSSSCELLEEEQQLSPKTQESNTPCDRDNGENLLSRRDAACIKEKFSNRACLLRSTKHSPDLGRAFEENLPLLITATPRSGTVGTMKFLKALGLSLSDDAHAPTDDGMVSWIHCFYSAEDDYYGPIRLQGRGFRTVLHQRRHVLKSITSLIYATPFGPTPRKGVWSNHRYKQFLKTHLSIDTSRSRTLMGLQTWVEMQLFLKEIADWHFRVEDLMSRDLSISEPIVRRIFASANQSPPSSETIQKRLSKVDPKENARQHRPTLTWENVYEIDEYYGSIAYKLSKEYGYEDDA